jgi:hypothetical protein
MTERFAPGSSARPAGRPARAAHRAVTRRTCRRSPALNRTPRGPGKPACSTGPADSIPYPYPRQDRKQGPPASPQHPGPRPPLPVSAREPAGKLRHRPRQRRLTRWSVRSATMETGHRPFDGKLAHCLDPRRRAPAEAGGTRVTQACEATSPGCPSSPPAQTTGPRSLRVLTITGHDAALAGELDVALRLALVDGGRSDGPCETWIVPADATGPLAAARRMHAGHL